MATREEDPLRRSHRSNAMYPKEAEKLVVVAKKVKPAKQQSQGLNKSAYVRDNNAFSIIQKDIATGNSKYTSDVIITLSDARCPWN